VRPFVDAALPLPPCPAEPGAVPVDAAEFERPSRVRAESDSAGAESAAELPGGLDEVDVGLFALVAVELELAPLDNCRREAFDIVNVEKGESRAEKLSRHATPQIVPATSARAAEGEDFEIVKRPLERAGANEPAVAAGHVPPPVTRRPGSHSNLAPDRSQPLIMRNRQTPKRVLE
jgi:hypothetical protein